MASIGSEEDDYSRYSAYNETDSAREGDTPSFAVQTKAGAGGSHSLTDANFDNHRVKQRKQQPVYSRDEFLYALSSPSSIGAMAWIVSSFMAVIFGSSIVVSLNFCIPLLVGPFVINEQISAQLSPSVRRKYKKLRSEANVLAMTNVQLKGSHSRLQRQEYRLSVVEERFEHLCKRSEKDITQMKHLAKKNAALRQNIKATLAAEKIRDLLTNMLAPDYNGNCLINEKQIDEIVMLMKVFAGKNASSKFDIDEIHEAVVNSMANNPKISLLPPSIDDSDSETRDSEREYNNERRMNDVEDTESLHRNHQEMGEPVSVQRSFEGTANKSTKEEDESWYVPTTDTKTPSLRLDPSGHSVAQKWRRNEDFAGMVETSISNGTVDEPIDIEKLLFSNNSGQTQDEQTHRNWAQPDPRTTSPPIE